MQRCHLWCHQHHMILAPVSVVSHDQNVMLALISVILTYEIQWDHWWCCWHHMMQTPIASCDQKYHISPYFNCLDPRNAVVPLTRPFVSCGANACTNAITWPKMSCALHFNHLDLRNKMVPLTMSSASYNADTSANSVTWLKKLCCTQIWSC